MPSPGQSTILNDIANTSYTVEGGYNVSFTNTNSFLIELSHALHAGWTSSSPTTSTTMLSSFATRGFASYWGYPIFLQCIASGIDAEVNAWVASWDDELFIHTYTVNASSIYNRIRTCEQVKSNGTAALAQACATMFANYFGQEVG